MRPRILVVNGDDFGYSAAINAAIVHCHREGILTSASLLVNRPATRAALTLARDLPGLGVGLHVNLTEGGPVLPPGEVPALTDRRGQFLPLGALLPRLLAGRVRPGEIEQEVRAQFAIMLHAGLRPTHVDGHLHAHALPGVLPTVLRLMAEYGVRAMRSPLLAAWMPRGVGRGPWAVGRGPKGARASRVRAFRPAPLALRLAPFVAALERGRAASLRRADVTYPAALFDAAGFLAAGDPAQALATAVAAAPGDRAEVMAHPAWNRDARRGAAEVALLTDPRLRAMLDSRGVRLERYEGLRTED